MLTSCLTAVKKIVIRYCEKVYERSGKNLIWSIKNSGEILDKFKYVLKRVSFGNKDCTKELKLECAYFLGQTRDLNATSLSTYDFSTLYTTLPHNLDKDKLFDLIERTFQRESSTYLACNDRNAFLLRKNLKNIMHDHVKMYVMR